MDNSVFAILVSALVVVGSVPAGAADVCAVRAVASPGLANRGRVITLSGGREVTLVGQNHGDRQSYESIEELASRPKSDVPSADYLSSLSYQVNPDVDADDDQATKEAAIRVRLTMAESKQEAAYLAAYLTQHPNTGYIGIEGTPEAVKTRLQIAARVCAAVHSSFESRKLAPNPLEEALKLFSFGAPIRLAMTDAKAKSKLLGYVSPALSEKVAAAVRAMSEAAAQLRSSVGGQQVYSRFNEFFRSWDLTASVSDAFSTAGYASYNPETDDAKIIAAAKSKFLGKDWMLVQPYLVSQLGLLKAAKLRDRSDASTLSGQSSSGIMFVGRAHLDSVTAILRQNCLADQKRADAAKSTGAASSAR